MPAPGIVVGRNMISPQGAFDGEQQGRFFSSFPGATPKFALNRGPRRSDFVETMARLIVDMPPDMLQVFRQSLPADTAAASRTLVYTGDITQLINGAGTGTGYFDFLLTQVQMGRTEREQTVDTLTDNTVVFYGGQSAPVLSCNGTFLNTYQDDQNVWFQLLYSDVLRGTQLARRGLVARFKYDSFFVSGYLMNLTTGLTAGVKNAVDFSFNFRVKQIQISTPILYNPSQGQSLFDRNIFISPSPRGADDQTRHGIESAEQPETPSARPAAGTQQTNTDPRRGSLEQGVPAGIQQQLVDSTIVAERERAQAALPADPEAQQAIASASAPVVAAGGDVRQQLPPEAAATFQTFTTVDTTEPPSTPDALTRVQMQINQSLVSSEPRGTQLVSPVTGATQRSGTYADTIARAPIVQPQGSAATSPGPTAGVNDTAYSQELLDVYRPTPELLAEFLRKSSPQGEQGTLPRSRQRATG